MCTLGFVVPILVFIIVYFSPKSTTTIVKKRTSGYMVLLGIYLTLMFLFVGGALALLGISRWQIEIKRESQISNVTPKVNMKKNENK